MVYINIMQMKLDSMFNRNRYVSDDDVDELINEFWDDIEDGCIIELNHPGVAGKIIIEIPYEKDAMPYTIRRAYKSDFDEIIDEQQIRLSLF